MQTVANAAFYVLIAKTINTKTGMCISNPGFPDHQMVN